MSNYYAVLPAEVRYNKYLSPMAKLLYAEITAKLGRNGKCKVDVPYFTRALHLNSEQVRKHLNELRVEKHIYNIKGVISLLKAEAKIDSVQLEIDVDFTEEVVKKWNDLFHKESFDVGIRKTDELTAAVNDRLAVFSKDDIIKAMENRHTYVTTNEWHQKPENIIHQSKIMTIMLSDEKMQSALNFKKVAMAVNIKNTTVGEESGGGNLDVLE